MINFVLLLVTWMSGPAASSYQLEFQTVALCEAAQRHLLEDAARINGNANPPRVILSAVCVDQTK